MRVALAIALLAGAPAWGQAAPATGQQTLAPAATPAPAPTPAPAAALPTTGVLAASFPARLFQGGSNAWLRVPLAGLADSDLELRVSAVDIVKVEAGGETLTGIVPVVRTTCDGAATGDEPRREVAVPRVFTLGARESCRLRFDLGDVDAGDYRLRAALRAGGGDPRSFELPFKVRAPWFAMLFWLALGASTGGFVAWWRDGRLARTDAELAVARLQAELDDIIAGEPRAAPLAARGVALRRRLGTDEPLAAIETDRLEFAKRITELRRVLAYWRFADSTDRPALAGRFETALLQLADADLDPGPAVEAFVKAVSDAVNAKALGPTESAFAPRIAPAPAAAGIVTIERERDLYNAILALLLGFLFVVVALLTVWWPDADWGSFADKAAAILIGASAFGGVATTIGTFRTAATANKVT